MQPHRAPQTSTARRMRAVGFKTFRKARLMLWIGYRDTTQGGTNNFFRGSVFHRCFQNKREIAVLSHFQPKLGEYCNERS